MSDRNLKVLLAARPNGAVKESDFEVVEADMPKPAGGEILLRNRFLSIDPYMRVRMNEGRSYATNLQIGDVMVGDTAAEVIESHNPDFKIGDTLVGRLGWQRYAISNGVGLRKVDPASGPLSAHLGVLGMPGVTAWYGLLQIGRPVAGETVVVAAASGAVGSVVGQIAKIHGCRVVGIAGGKMKTRHVVDELGFDAFVDHRSPNFVRELTAAVPEGVNIYFDTVGGVVLDTILTLCRPFSRIPLCGMINDYDTTQPYGVQNLYSAIANRIHLEGFIISDHAELWPQAISDLSSWIRTGILTYRETVSPGLETAPSALIGLLKGDNLGKQLVQIT
jgi:NADPH-dependent curcumin reductase CurA